MLCHYNTIDVDSSQNNIHLKYNFIYIHIDTYLERDAGLFCNLTEFYGPISYLNRKCSVLTSQLNFMGINLLSFEAVTINSI